MKIDRNSYGILAAMYLLAAGLSLLTVLFIPLPWICWPLCAVYLWFVIWQTHFFIVPSRKRVGNSHLVTSVADGRVLFAKRTVESEYLKRECLQIAVYMNFFDTHANFWPVDGTVTYYQYHPGEHMLAFEPKASLKNEHTCILVETPEGVPVFFKQIAGGFARRIVCRAKPGLQVKAGTQCGIIKFGSRIDIYLPTDAKLRVRSGDIVRSCETVLAEI
ncbi:MAG: phosphatidylserine decarboxylase [Bacteroidales bacterium]|nr:phosphatidylserine decarboxylase [Bacteroidales bacterium]